MSSNACGHSTDPGSSSNENLIPQISSFDGKRTDGARHLTLQGQQIRVLTVLEDRDEDRIQCSSRVIDLRERPTYDALSYTWSPATRQTEAAGVTDAPCVPIIYDGEELMVTNNLHDFLLQYRRAVHTTAHRPIWIDAICIRQDEVEERSSQVMLMTEIYRGARTVIVWLGQAGEETRYALQMIRRMAPFSEHEIGQLNFWESYAPMAIIILGDLAGSEPHWKALARFLQRRWFDRVWVLQEVAVSEDVVMLCGQETLSWLDFANACAGFGRGHVNINLRNFAYDDGARFGSGVFEAADDRDKVFALLGLRPLLGDPKATTTPLVADYTKSVEEIYIQATRTAIEEQQSLTLLHLTDDRAARKYTNLPSWCPDYSQPGTNNLGWMCSSIFNASSGVRPVFSFSDDSALLTLKGAMIDVVTTVAESAANKHPGIEGWLHILAALDTTYKYTDQSRLEAFWRTLISDFSGHGIGQHPASTDFAEFFKVWLGRLAARIFLKANDNDLDDVVSFNTPGDVPRNFIPPTLVALEALAKQADLQNGLPTHDFVLRVALAMQKNTDGTPPAWLLHGLSTSLHYERALNVQPNRRLFATRSGYLGMGSEFLRQGDEIYIVQGARMPLTVRHRNSDDCHELVGEAYVHGLMHGEFLNRPNHRVFRDIQID